ncbi:glycoside hydrolase family 76 protein [Mycena albidolilacea]|uniref:Glycoside hydrolase family 76 protein n=1 Tax=Mycena albidolilacea TaxID=1033008 RepID=A0AAD7A733_9AGAR|nr:glycoside hydrolase family 76 protein [Mycena albidolilacea]
MFSTLSAASLALLASSPLVSAKCQQYVDAAVTAAANLQSTYFVNGGYGSQQPWIGAVDSFHLSELDDLAGVSTYSNVINTVFTAWEGQLDNGNSYDDVQWVSIAYLRAGNLAQAQKYYDIASTAVNTDYCGGGLFWNGNHDYKNAITNELYITTSGYLYDVTKNGQYLTNLQTTWSWLKASGMMGSNGLFNDGLSNVNGVCSNNQGTQWTYNQGALLPGLAYLYKYTGDESAITSAWGIIDSIIMGMTINNGLREPCESTTQNFCNADQQTFKGITVHYISWFLSVSGRDNGSKYSDFLRAQADKVLQFSVGPAGFYSNLWYDSNAGAATWTASSQASALGALIAAGQQNC